MTILIRTATPADLPAFFDYLDDHLRDNGAGTIPLFQPMPRGATFPPDKRGTFEQGLATPLTQPGWRRLWLALDGAAIAGHIDLRARPEAAAPHRALLGMGVDRAARRGGLGLRLLDAAIGWAAEAGTLAWIDLEVLSGNAPARALYCKRGFEQTGEIPDLFRIDGESLGYCYMSLRLSRR